LLGSISIPFGKTYEEQLHNLQLVFDRIKIANLKLSPKKCEFFKRKVKFVGPIVNTQQILRLRSAKTFSISRWYVAGEFVNPNGMRLYS
jgi:hypothetical protein